MKIYIPNNSQQSVGGGWSFIRNIGKALASHGVRFVNSWQECDVVLICGVTMTNTGEMHEAKKAGKTIIFRVDNVPRKSRNHRNTPHERMQEFAKLADAVIYQSQWAMEYCRPLCGEGMIIYNGVDTEIFNKSGKRPKENTYLFMYHGRSELKQFWLAHYYFQMVHRKDLKAEFWFTYEFKRELQELQDANFDFWNGEPYVHLPVAPTPEAVAQVMKQCTHFICPYTVEAAPNTLLEALHCGLTVVGHVEMDGVSIGGVKEYLDLWDKGHDFSLTRMGEDYIGLMRTITNRKNAYASAENTDAMEESA
mgnify:CR=1 FL=1